MKARVKRTARTTARRGRRDNPLVPPAVAEWVVGSNIIDTGQRYIKSRFAKSMRRKKRNPGVDLEEVTKVSEDFHGRSAKEVIEIIEETHYDDKFAALGDLCELTVIYRGYTDLSDICFKKNKPLLVCDKDRRNLDILGGDQCLNVEAQASDLVEVGYIVIIAYKTDKHHLEDSDGEVVEYSHFFGEETFKKWGYDRNKYKDDEQFLAVICKSGVLAKACDDGIIPCLLYDCRNEKMLIAGGEYKVEDVGIRN